MILKIKEIERILLKYPKKFPFSQIIADVYSQGYSSSEMKKALIHLQELGVIEIEKKDFIIVEYLDIYDIDLSEIF